MKKEVKPPKSSLLAFFLPLSGFFGSINRMRSIAYLCLFLSLFASCATNQLFTRKEKKTLEKEIVASPVFSKSHTGFALYDVATKQMVYESDANKYFTPASNTKIFTLFTALNFLGDSIPALKYYIQGDSLIFWGTGDPSLLHPKLTSNNRVVNFLKNRPETLFYCPDNFMDERYGSGWAWDDYLYYYQVEKSAMPIYANLITINKAAQTSNFDISPAYFRANINDSLAIKRTKPRFKRAIENNQMVVEGQLALDKAFQQEIPFHYSDTLLVHLMQLELGKEIQLISGISFPLEKRQTLYSIATDSVYQLMMQDSDNFLAEQLLLLCSNELFDTMNTRKIIQYAKETILKDATDTLQWIDGSGLSRYNLFTPRSIISVLESLYHTLSIARLQAIFPAGGETGTVKNLYGGVNKPFIYAKTGTLSNRHCLSGYLFTKSGKVLLFSFMHNNYYGNSLPLKMEMDKVLRRLHEEE